eukprot:Colp12_sorted_trinity150504_noHs@9942
MTTAGADSSGHDTGPFIALLAGVVTFCVLFFSVCIALYFKGRRAWKENGYQAAPVLQLDEISIASRSDERLLLFDDAFAPKITIETTEEDEHEKLVDISDHEIEGF